MKRSLRRPFALLLVLIVFLSVLSFRAVINNQKPTIALSGPGPDIRLNLTILRLAAVDPSEASIQRDVDDLLDGRLPATSASGRSDPWRRENHHHLLLRHRHEAVSNLDPDHLTHWDPHRHYPKYHHLLSDSRLRFQLRSWHRRRRFQPSVLRELSDTVGPLLNHEHRPASCAVVGNSGILLRADHGALIDAHDIVIRLNNARVEGFARHVGAKTNLSFINSNILHLCARRPGCFCHPYGDTVPILMYICQAAHFLDLASCNSSAAALHRAPIRITDPRLDVLCARIVKYYSIRRFVSETGRSPDEWAATHDAMMFHYSSGMQAVMVAVGVCERVAVFGFGKAADAKHHYHTNQKAELDLHDYEAEYAFYKDLAERPEVIPFVKDARFKVPPVVFYQ